MDELELKIQALDVKDKILFVQGYDTDALRSSDLQHLQEVILQRGGMGVIFMGDGDISTETLDGLIGHLQKLKREMSN